MDSITQEDVLQILKIVEASNTDELHLETGDLKLIIRKANPRTAKRAGSDDLRDRIEDAGIRRKDRLGCRHSSRQGIKLFCG